MILCGECLALLHQLRDRCIDHAITDPPYSPHVHEAGRRGCTGYREPSRPNATGAQFHRVRDLGFAPLTDELRSRVALELARVCRRWILVFCDHEGGQAWREALEAAGAEFVRFGVWIKLGATPQFSGDRPAVGHEVIVIAHAPRPNGGRLHWNGGGRHAVWTHPIVLDRGHNGARLHTTQKPLALLENLVRDFTDPEESILDPFAGSGTTSVAAKRLGRHSMGFEVDPTYAEIARKRFEEARYQPELFPSRAPAPRADQLTLDIGTAPPARGWEPRGAGEARAPEED